MPRSKVQISPSQFNNENMSLGKMLGNFTCNSEELEMALTLAKSRPKPLRDFDQISMVGVDMIHQAKIFGPYLKDRSVVFMGDNDGASAMFGMLGALGNPCPAEMLVVDFDNRVLQYIRKLAMRYGFINRIKFLTYNAFEAIPTDIAGKYDWFYTNPPYGSRNKGASGELFITRGMEFTGSGGKGCIILPDDENRRWAQAAMYSVQKFLLTHGWGIGEKANEMHHYVLDDDPYLASTLMWVQDICSNDESTPKMPFSGRSVKPNEIPFFYGRSTPPQLPRFITTNGKKNYNWQEI